MRALGMLMVLLLFAVMVIYNRGQKYKRNVYDYFAALDKFLLDRWEVLPSFIKMIENYVSEDNEILKKIKKIRSGNYPYMNMNERIVANRNLSLYINQIINFANTNTNIQEDNDYVNFINEINKNEDKIFELREDYNYWARKLNKYTQVFQIKLLTDLLDIGMCELYEIRGKIN